MNRFIDNFITIMLSLLLFSCGTEEYKASVGRVEGIVINASSKEPIYGCEVISSTHGTKFTDSNGRFLFEDIPGGQITLEYKCQGYEQSRQTVDIHIGQTTQANISLIPVATLKGIHANTSILDFSNTNSVMSLVLSNYSESPISFSIESEANWISAVPQQGVIVGNGDKVVKISVDRGAISNGHYDKIIKVITAEKELSIQITVDKGEISRPKVETISVYQDSKGLASIVAKGSISNIGGSEVTQHGFQYSENSSLTENTPSTCLGNLSSPSDFSGLITDLKYGIKYYVRAYATNSVGTSYGETLEITLNKQEEIEVMTLEASDLTSSSACLIGSISKGEISNITEYGFLLGTNINSLNKLTTVTRDNNIFKLDVSNLKSDTKYYFKAYVISGTQVEGEIKTFTTPTNNTSDNIQINTLEASDIAPTSAILNGNLKNSNESYFKEYGFFYGTSENPTLRIVVDANKSNKDIGNYQAKLKDLKTNTTYYFCAYYISENNEVIYSVVKSFRTTDSSSVVLKTAKIIKADNYNSTYNINFILSAELYPQGKKVIEAGFLLKHELYSYDYNKGYDFKFQCEIKDNRIDCSEIIKYVYQLFFYARAYMILSDGTIVYSQNSKYDQGIYFSEDMPYNYKN